MTELTSARAAWESFYVIVGSSGGALTPPVVAERGREAMMVTATNCRPIHNAWDSVTHLVVGGSEEGTNRG